MLENHMERLLHITFEQSCSIKGGAPGQNGRRFQNVYYGAFGLCTHCGADSP